MAGRPVICGRFKRHHNVAGGLLLISGVVLSGYYVALQLPPLKPATTAMPAALTLHPGSRRPASAAYRHHGGRWANAGRHPSFGR